ncbi:hypothetical protein Tco_0240953 [Tanacetum coccineum]
MKSVGNLTIDVVNRVVGRRRGKREKVNIVEDERLKWSQDYNKAILIDVVKANVKLESDLWYLVNHDTLMFILLKINPILEEFTGELAHIAPILSGIVEADPDDDTLSDDDDFESLAL